MLPRPPSSAVQPLPAICPFRFRTHLPAVRSGSLAEHRRADTTTARRITGALRAGQRCSSPADSSIKSRPAVISAPPDARQTPPAAPRNLAVPCAFPHPAGKAAPHGLLVSRLACPWHARLAVTPLSCCVAPARLTFCGPQCGSVAQHPSIISITSSGDSRSIPTRTCIAQKKLFPPSPLNTL